MSLYCYMRDVSAKRQWQCTVANSGSYFLGWPRHVTEYWASQWQLSRVNIPPFSAPSLSVTRSVNTPLRLVYPRNIYKVVARHFEHNGRSAILSHEPHSMQLILCRVWDQRKAIGGLVGGATGASGITKLMVSTICNDISTFSHELGRHDASWGAFRDSNVS